MPAVWAGREHSARMKELAQAGQRAELGFVLRFLQGAISSQMGKQLGGRDDLIDVAAISTRNSPSAWFWSNREVLE